MGQEETAVIDHPPDGYEGSSSGGDHPPDGYESSWFDIAKDIVKSLPNPQTNPVTKSMDWLGKNVFKPGLETYEKSQIGSPSQLLQDIPGQISKGAGKLGEKTAEELAGPGISPDLMGFSQSIKTSPEVAAGIGTAITYAPYIAMMAANPPGKPPSIAGEATPAAEAVSKTAPIAEEAAKVAPEIPKPATPLPQSIQDLLGKASSKIPDDVKEFVKNKTAPLTEKPINQGTAQQYLERGAYKSANKTLGFSPGQIGKLGKEKIEKLDRWAYDKGLVNVTTGDIGVGEKVNQILKDSGQVVGDMRNVAAQRGATHNMQDLISTIHSKIGDKYESGINSGEHGSYIKALQEITKTPPTADKIANTVTDLFHKAKNENVAAGLRSLKSPEGPYADVARELRKANEDLMAKHLEPKELDIYHNALEDFGAATQVNEGIKMKYRRDMGGRLPPGMGIGRAGLQKGLDAIGYRFMGQVQNNVAKFLKSNPKALTTPKEIFRHLVDESADAAEEMVEGVR